MFNHPSFFITEKLLLQERKSMFSNKDIFKLIIPLIIEQILNSVMGMMDSLMVSTVGPTAISAVSLVDSINTLIIQVFSALATGGAIVCSQYIGSRNHKKANESGQQLLLSVFAISLIITAFAVILRRPLLSLIFGSVEPAIMNNALTYLVITAFSYPFIALYNAGAALYRACGNSKYPMTISMVANVVNVAGNAILIFGLHCGVEGVAIPTLVSRAFCAVVVLYSLRKPKQEIVISNYSSMRPQWALIGTILSVGIPTGIENGMFQFGKLAIQSTVSTLGTDAIAANAMQTILESFNSMAAIGIGLGTITIVGQCMGAGRPDEAKRYIIKLAKYAEVALIISCALTYFATRPLAVLGNMTPESTRMFIEMSTFVSIIKPIPWIFSFSLAYGMRAAGDVKFSMIVSSITMWTCRVLIVTILCRVFGFGPIAVWIGMACDWFVRGICFTTRFISGRWSQIKVIDKAAGN